MQSQLKQQLSRAGRDEALYLYGKNRPAQAGIPVAETGIPPRRDGTKNVPPPYKQYVIKTIETYACRDPGHRPVPANVPTRLSYKQALIAFAVWTRAILIVFGKLTRECVFQIALETIRVLKRIYQRPTISDNVGARRGGKIDEHVSTTRRKC